jgi:hypothetical protein
MSLSTDYLYRFVLKLVRKNQAGTLSSVEFTYHWNDAQNAYFDDLLGRFQRVNNGKEGANTGLIENETILTKLSPFTTSEPLTVTSGNSDKPTDFSYRLAMRVSGYECKKINQSQIAAVNNSVIDAPSITSNLYYFLEYEDYYSFLPSTITAATLDYISQPKDIKWGYTFDADGRQVYNSGTSIQPMWDDSSCREITKRMLTNIGVSLKDADFLNFGKSVQMAGE